MSCEVMAFVSLPVQASRVRRRVNTALKLLNYNPRTANVSVALVGDGRMRALNQQYRRRPGTTDVLSFPGRGSELGEIVISVPQARRQARTYGLSLARELDLLLIHGLLHLAGYNHTRPRERRRMEQREQKLLQGRSLIRRSSRL